MQGKKDVIDILNEALKHELGAVNQYWLHYRMLDNWGFTKLAKKERKELIEEMQHADKLVARIIFLEGLPNLQYRALDDRAERQGGAGVRPQGRVQRPRPLHPRPRDLPQERGPGVDAAVRGAA